MKVNVECFVIVAGRCFRLLRFCKSHNLSANKLCSCYTAEEVYELDAVNIVKGQVTLKRDEILAATLARFHFVVIVVVDVVVLDEPKR